LLDHFYLKVGTDRYQNRRRANNLALHQGSMPVFPIG